jgi:hypothetical protein
MIVETGKTLLRTASAFAALFAIPAMGIAQHADNGAKASASENEMPAREIGRAMLDDLLKRRTAVAQSAASGESKRAALEFLDRQIANVRSGLAG